MFKAFSHVLPLPMVSYAQNFEDVMLDRVFREVDHGFYIDVGAWHPQRDSVTKHFYDNGWDGINIEPVEYLHSDFESARPRDINLKVGVSRADGDRLLYDFAPSGNSTFDPQLAQEFLASGMRLRERIVHTRRLDTICQEYGVSEIAFLKVDVEGSESEVLESLDWQRYRPVVVVVEAVHAVTRVDTQHAWEPQLLANGYGFVYFDGLNRFYVRNEDAQLARHFRVPPNVFDNFVCAAPENPLAKLVLRSRRTWWWRHLARPLWNAWRVAWRR